VRGVAKEMGIPRARRPCFIHSPVTAPTTARIKPPCARQTPTPATHSYGITHKRSVAYTLEDLADIIDSSGKTSRMTDLGRFSSRSSSAGKDISRRHHREPIRLPTHGASYQAEEDYSDAAPELPADFGG